MIISRMQNGHWFKGDHPEAFWRYSANSDDPDKALASAKTTYYRKFGKQRPASAVRPVVEDGGYLIPEELVPIGAETARCMGARYYVGSACAYHKLNCVRVTRTRECGVCEILRQKTGSPVIA